MSESNYVVERLKKIKRMMSDFIEEDLNVFQKILIIIDLACSILINGCGINEYFQYQFYKKRHADRKNFIVHRKRSRLHRICNDVEASHIFDHKPAFNKVFSEYLVRDWLNLEKCTLEDFQEFILHHERVIVKPIYGRHGKGVRMEIIDDTTDIETLFYRLREEKAMVEEVIQQSSELAQFNPTSVNTLRVVTLLCADGNPRIMTANLRMGNGDKYADNFHHNGIATLLNVDTGIVVTPGIDRNFKRYIIHPASGKQIIGFRIPYWDKVVDTVKKAALVVPNVRYVGWDVAIDKNGQILLVEGNSMADPDVSQMPDQIGKWPLYKDYLDELKSI